MGMRKVNIFIVCGPQDMPHIYGVLAPSIYNAAADLDPRISILNYLGNELMPAETRLPAAPKIADYSTQRENGRIGFGEGINFLFRRVNPEPYFIVLNPDTFVYPGFFTNLISKYDRGTTGIIDAHQWPAAHPKDLRLAQDLTPWASGAACLIDSEIFDSLNGFDENYFLYCEDVDLSWRIWLAGKRVLHAGNALVAHFTGSNWYRKHRFYPEHYYSLRNFPYISYKFFGLNGEKRAMKLISAEVDFVPPRMKEIALQDYRERLRPLVVDEFAPARHPMIFIKGFNLYHNV